MSLERISRYQIVSELGKGAMGVVYKATDPNIGRTIALKTLRLDAHGIELDEMLKRFKNEARAVGALSHPNIITIYDAGDAEDMFYIAMEFIEGKTLQEMLRAERVLPVDQIQDIVRQVCSGLDYAHSKGIIHRDVKPANIMMQNDGTVKLMDFGIAKGGGSGLTSTGQVVGTPNYMSPEQVKGRQLDGRSDLFSLGVVLYEMLLGERPFTGENVTTIIYKIMNETPASPRDLDVSVHPGLSAVVMKALAKSPDERYQDGAEMAEGLQDYKSFGAGGAATTQMAQTTAMPSSGAHAAPPSSGIPMKPPVPVPPTPAPSGIRMKGETAAPRPAAATPSGIPMKPMAPVSKLESTVSHRQAAAPEPQAKKPVGLIVGIAFLAVAIFAAGGYFATHKEQVPAAPSTTATATPKTEASAPATKPAAAEPAATPAAPVAPTVGDIHVGSTPPGAAFTIDGRSEPKWVTPFTVSKLKPGQHTIVLTLDGYASQTLHADVVAGKRASVAAAMEAMKSYLAVTSNPIGARIFLDGQDSGEVTPARLTVDPGQHRIAVRKPGFKPEVTLADVGAGQTLNFAPQLTPGPAGAKAAQQEAAPAEPQANKMQQLRRFFKGNPGEDGTVQVRTQPAGAQIWVGPYELPVTTPTSFPMAPGTYKVTVRMNGYRPTSRIITVEKGKTVGIDEVLAPQ